MARPASMPMFKADFALKKHYLEVVRNDEDTADEKKLWIEGYASHGAVDTYGDEISKAGMEDLASKMAGVVLLHNHDADQEIGKVDEAKYVEEEPAVWVKCWIALGKDEKLLDDPDSTASKIMDGRIDSFSIHAYASEIRIIDTPEEFKVIIEAWERVIELSVTSVPVQEKAKIQNTSIKGLGYYVKCFGTEVRDMKKDELEKAVEKALANPEGALGKLILTAVTKAMKEASDPPADPPADPPEPVAPKADDPPEDPPADPPEDPPEEEKAIDGKAEADFLLNQAAALEALELEGDAADAVAGVVSALKARAEEVAADEEEEEASDDGPEEEEEKAIDDEIESKKAEVKALEKKLKALKDKETASRQETHQEPEDKDNDKPKAKYASFGNMLNLGNDK